MTARVIINVVLALLLLGTGGGKLAQAKSSLAIRDSLNIGNSLWRTIGALEILGVIGLIFGICVPAAGLAASVGVVALMVGAIAARARARQRQPGGYAADTLFLLIAAASVVLHALALQ